MKFNKIFLFTLILLAALSFSAVSAESVDGDDTVAINDANNVIVSEQSFTDVISASEPTVSDDVNQNSSTGGDVPAPSTNTSTGDNGTAGGNGTNSSTPEKNSTIISEDISLFYKNGTKFSAIFLDENGKALANQNITFVINGVAYNKTTDKNGAADIGINLAPGSYVIESKNLATNESVKNNVTVISTINTANVVKLYRNGTHYYATFVDGQGNVLANKTVKFNINGVFYTKPTDANGTARLNIWLYPGKYILTAYNPINNEAKAGNVTVLSTINGTDVTKYYRNDTHYSAVIVDSNGTPVANKTVRLNINGVFYNKTTDENGTVRLNIWLLPGNYTITVYNPSNGEENSNKVIVLPKLIAKDMTMDYQAGKNYTVKVVDGQGKALANQTVKININGVIYTKTTDANGIAYLGIRLNPGNYVCTSYWNDSFVSTKIVVNKLTASISILTPTVKKGDYYKVKITDKKSNNPIVNHLVIFVYNGTAYGAYSDNEGIAKIKIGLPAGSYQLITAIQNSNWYQNIQVHSTLKVTA
jgi:uncharacterized protein YbcV (DUF1398 family)